MKTKVKMHGVALRADAKRGNGGHLAMVSGHAGTAPGFGRPGPNCAAPAGP
jgi:hypothetical protein